LVVEFTCLLEAGIIASMSRICLFALALVLCGCGGGSDDAKIIGDWRGEFLLDSGKKLPGANISFDKDHHFRELFKNFEVVGSWSLSGKKITFQTEKISGLTIEEYRKKLDALHNPKVRALSTSLDKPTVFVLSDDGRTLVGEGVPAAGGHTQYVKESP
jgi:hypothetical protein